MSSTAASRPAPPPIPSHSNFLRAQIRSSLAHLRATSDIDENTFQQIDSLLTTGSTATATSQAGPGVKQSEEEKQLGANNAWLRKALVETSLLSDTVSLALSIAIPSGLIGSAQQESILLLVERSKIKIANAITDPNIQKRTSKGAITGVKGAHAGIRRGINVAGQSITQKREESKSKSELKKAEKEEQKAIKDELKRERKEILVRRQKDMLGSDASGRQSESTEASVDNDDYDSTKKTSTSSKGHITPAVTLNPTEAEPIATDIDGDAMVSVSCSQLSPQGSVAATTIFSPWPGLLLTSTLVASNDEDKSSIQSDDEDDMPVDKAATAIQPSGPVPPPPRRAAPLPNQSSLPALGDDVGLLQSVQRQLSTRPDAPQSSQPPPLASTNSTNRFEDVTDSKQKSWTKKLGL
jgi:hypothetical protein